MSESLVNNQKRLRWQCRRGMLELDVLLQNFFDQQYQKLTPIDQKNFERLLTHLDQDLYRWLLGSDQPHDAGLKRIVNYIRFKKISA